MPGYRARRTTTATWTRWSWRYWTGHGRSVSAAVSPVASSAVSPPDDSVTPPSVTTSADVSCASISTDGSSLSS
jgi:hypothetical protein